MGDALGNLDILLSERALTTPVLETGAKAVCGPIPEGSSALPPGASYYDDKLGRFVAYPRGNYEAKAVFGEQNMAFVGMSTEGGWHVLAGPSGSAGHPYNDPGFDGVAFPATGEFKLRIVDNKALKSATVRSATAITTNLQQNLESLHVAATSSRYDDVPRITEVRQTLAVARRQSPQGPAAATR